MGELEMFEKGKQLEAVEGAPGAVEVLPGLRLLPAVVIVEELVHYPAKNKNISGSSRPAHPYVYI